MKLLAIDFGTKRLGFAFGNTTLRTAIPLMPYQRKNIIHDCSHISEMIKMYEIEKVILGYPYNMDGTRGPILAKVERFKEELTRRIDIPIAYFDERLTSFAAEEMIKSTDHSGKKRQYVDSLSALIILKDYMEAL